MSIDRPIKSIEVTRDPWWRSVGMKLSIAGMIAAAVCVLVIWYLGGT
jgi:hypothetical protein